MLEQIFCMYSEENLLEFAEEWTARSLHHLFLDLDWRPPIGSSDFVSPLEQLWSTVIVSNLTFNQDWSSPVFSRRFYGDSKLSSGCSLQTKSLAIF
jgi:hypothetical protein